jgi:dTDP-4-amino-4,6-dideoxygalactose transaminase
VPVDVREDGLLDPAQLRSAITSRCRAIVPVHLYGKLADMGPILSVAASHGLSVVEDAAQAHGAERDGKRAGSFGIASAFSFYPTKNLGALGDGGAICTSDPELAARLRRLHNYGSDRKYLHEIIGHNSRLDELQAAYLAVKLPHLLSSNARRRQIAARYSRALMPVAHDGLQLAALSDGSVWHQFVIRVANRRPVQQALAADGIGTTIHYPVAPFDQACFAGQFDRTRFPVATRLAETVLSLPMGDYLSDEEVDYVIHSVQNACQPVAA